MNYSNIKSLRKERKMTLRQLSDRCGVSIGYVSELENGTPRAKNPSFAFLKKIAEALDCDVSHLVGERKETRKYLKEIESVAYKLSERDRWRLYEFAKILRD